MTDKVLIVEDEQALRESLAYSLLREGYQVETAEDGQKGLELALRWTPDLILLDIMLPDRKSVV